MEVKPAALPHPLGTPPKEPNTLSQTNSFSSDPSEASFTCNELYKADSNKGLVPVLVFQPINISKYEMITHQIMFDQISGKHKGRGGHLLKTL